MTPETLRYLLRLRSGESPSGDIEQLRPHLTRVHERQRANAELNGPDDYGDTAIDRAKALGLIGETRTIAALDCRFCAGLPWRRQLAGCPECHGEFREELVRMEIASPQSGLFRANEWL